MSISIRIDVMFGSAVLAAALFFGTLHVQEAILRTRTDDHTIRVPGAAKRRVESDLAIYRATVSYQAAVSASGYQDLAEAMSRLEQALRSRRGKPPASESFQTSAIAVREVCQSDQCRRTGALDHYELSQSLEIRSPDLSGLGKLAGETSSLVQQAALTSAALKLEVREIDYVFTHLEELKLQALTEATRNARERAEQLAGAAGLRLGAVLSASLGDVEIRIPNQPEKRYADDASSREKDVVSNVTVTYSVR